MIKQGEITRRGEEARKQARKGGEEAGEERAERKQVRKGGRGMKLEVMVYEVYDPGNESFLEKDSTKYAR